MRYRNPPLSWFRVQIPNESEYASDPHLISDFKLEDVIKKSNGRVSTLAYSLSPIRSSLGVKGKLWTKSPELTLTLILKCQSNCSLALWHLFSASDIYARKASFPRRVLGRWSNVNLKFDWRKPVIFLLVWKVFWLEDESSDAEQKEASRHFDGRLHSFQLRLYNAEDMQAVHTTSWINLSKSLDNKFWFELDA